MHYQYYQKLIIETKEKTKHHSYNWASHKDCGCFPKILATLWRCPFPMLINQQSHWVTCETGALRAVGLERPPWYLQDPNCRFEPQIFSRWVYSLIFSISALSDRLRWECKTICGHRDVGMLYKNKKQIVMWNLYHIKQSNIQTVIPPACNWSYSQIDRLIDLLIAWMVDSIYLIGGLNPHWSIDWLTDWLID